MLRIIQAVQLVLGARPIEVLQYVLKRGVLSPLVGTIVGIPAALLTGRMAEGTLAGAIRSID
jgi:hypothetical protein